MDRKLKGIPVYAIALVLITGTVAGAGLWFLTVDVPVEYDDPVEITMYDERKYTDIPDEEYQYGGSEADFRFRDRHTHEVEGDDPDTDANLTYETFHQHVEIYNPGAEKEINVTIRANYDGESTGDIGLVFIGPDAPDEEYSHPVKPRNVTWEYEDEDPSENRTSAEFADNFDGNIDEGDGKVYWGGEVGDELPFKSITVGNEDTKEITVIYVQRLQGEGDDDPGDPIDLSEDYTIEWQFEDITDVDD